MKHFKKIGILEVIVLEFYDQINAIFILENFGKYQYVYCTYILPLTLIKKFD